MFFFSLILLFSPNYNEQIEKNKKILENAESMNKNFNELSNEMNTILNDVKNVKQKALSKQKEIEKYNEEATKIQKSNSKPLPEKFSKQIDQIKNSELEKTIKRSKPINISLLQLSSEKETITNSVFSKFITFLNPKQYVKGLIPKGNKIKSWDINGTNVSGLFRANMRSRVREIIINPYNKRGCIPKHISFEWNNNKGFSFTDEIDLPQSSSNEIIYHIQPKWFRDFTIKTNQTYHNNDGLTCIPEFNLFDGVFV